MDPPPSTPSGVPTEVVELVVVILWVLVQLPQLIVVPGVDGHSVESGRVGSPQ